MDQLKLSKSFTSLLKESGYTSPTEIQQQTMSRIAGGQNLIVVGPEGCGKTTTYILHILDRIDYESKDEAPKFLVLVPDKAHAEKTVEMFRALSPRRRELRIIGLHGTGSTDAEVSELVDGVDIVVAVPARARAVYLKLGLNLNKLQLFIVDDAELIVKQGMQLPVFELARSAGKCQQLVYTTALHDKLRNMLDQFMDFAVTIELDAESNNRIQTCFLACYQLPNFKTKVNLLYHLLRDDEMFTKAVVFVNSMLTAQKLSEHLHSVMPDEIFVLKPVIVEGGVLDDIKNFKQTADARILIVAEEGGARPDLSGIPFIFHMELPAQKELFLSRIARTEEEVVAINFVSGSELAELQSIERSIGFKIPVMDLPEGLVIDKSAE